MEAEGKTSLKVDKPVSELKSFVAAAAILKKTTGLYYHFLINVL